MWKSTLWLFLIHLSPAPSLPSYPNNLLFYVQGTVGENVLPTVDATGTFPAKIGLCHGCSRPDACNLALPLGVFPWEASVHSLRSGLRDSGHCRLCQWVWSYHHLRVGTFIFLCEHVLRFGMITIPFCPHLMNVSGMTLLFSLVLLSFVSYSFLFPHCDSSSHNFKLLGAFWVPQFFSFLVVLTLHLAHSIL